MSEWFKEAVLKTVVCLRWTVGSNPTPSARRFNVVKSHHWLVASNSWQRGFLQHIDATSKNLSANCNPRKWIRGEMAESAEGARLLSECGAKALPRVRIPLSPPQALSHQRYSCNLSPPRSIFGVNNLNSQFL